MIRHPSPVLRHDFFVTGTDTGVGKTVVATALLHAFAHAGERVIGMKPVASGMREGSIGHANEDVEALVAASNVDAPIELVNPYSFRPAIAPHLAARQAGCDISIEHIRICHEALAGRAGCVVVEGAGGLLVPLNATEDWRDVVEALQVPVILVVGMRLGCLNHALLTADALHGRGLSFAGWVANCVEADMPLFDENVETLRARLGAPLLGIMPHAPDANRARTALDLEILRQPSL
ncbi:MAG: dethiobiotin synthase [Betaproteobacteria bacterium]